MKKQITIATLAAYTVLTHYCLVYSMVTGNTHHATAIYAAFRLVNTEAQENHPQAACHSSPNASDSPSSGHEKSKHDDPCCITIFQNVPGIISAGIPLADSPILARLPTPTPGAADSQASLIVSRQDARGPPLPATQFFFLPHRSPRSPPRASL